MHRHSVNRKLFLTDKMYYTYIICITYIHITRQNNSGPEATIEQ